MTTENGDEKVYLNINSYPKGYQVILFVRAVFGAQAQQAGDSGPKDPQQ